MNIQSFLKNDGFEKKSTVDLIEIVDMVTVISYQLLAINNE
jgi:hypothetical protein